MQIRPHYPCIYTRSCTHQMVVVVPVGADCLKTPNINKKYRKQGYKRGERSISRHSYTENRDSDNDGHHSIAECFESCRTHYLYSSSKPARWASQLSTSFETALCRHLRPELSQRRSSVLKNPLVSFSDPRSGACNSTFVVVWPWLVG